jgi:nitroreductase
MEETNAIISPEFETFMKVIRGRRSIRKYKDQPIPREAIAAILDAARLAPTGENYQPWEFIVITDKKLITEIGLIGAQASGRRFLQEFLRGDLEKRFAAVPPEKREKIIKKLIEGRVSGFVATAPVVIAVCSVGFAGVDNGPDCAAATENLLLAAHALGLGACWVIGPTKDARDLRKVKALLGVPNQVHVPYVLSVGFPDESPNPRPRKPVSEIVYYNTYGNQEVNANV